MHAPHASFFDTKLDFLKKSRWNGFFGVELKRHLATDSRTSLISVLHIPIAQRERHAVLLVGLLQHISEEEELVCRLEEIRTKLLLDFIPREAHLRVELSRRLQL